jgi:hypothetical protein
VRNSLVAALVACADQPLKSEARRFLDGLSSDELQFIAEFLGSCMLESQVRWARNRAELAERISRFQRPRADGARKIGAQKVGAQKIGWMRSTDQEHKMILLLEYLCRSGVQELRTPVRSGGASVN